MNISDSIRANKRAQEYALACQRDVERGRDAVAAGDMPQHVLNARRKVADEACKAADRAWAQLVKAMEQA